MAALISLAELPAVQLHVAPLPLHAASAEEFTVSNAAMHIPSISDNHRMEFLRVLKLAIEVRVVV